MVKLSVKKNNQTIPIFNINNSNTKDLDIDIEDLDFAHLHVFSQFSVLQSTIHIKKLVDKVGELKMPALTLHH